jgi:hypothetical protein
LSVKTETSSGSFVPETGFVVDVVVDVVVAFTVVVVVLDAFADGFFFDVLSASTIPTKIRPAMIAMATSASAREDGAGVKPCDGDALLSFESGMVSPSPFHPTNLATSSGAGCRNQADKLLIT